MAYCMGRLIMLRLLLEEFAEGRAAYACKPFPLPLLALLLLFALERLAGRSLRDCFVRYAFALASLGIALAYVTYKCAALSFYILSSYWVTTLLPAPPLICASMA